MYQDFGRTALGSIKIETQAVVALVSRHLPKGVQCSAVRMRAHDRLCLVVISDKREFWSREDDLRRAKSIAEDLRVIGMELPRVQWIRQNRFLSEPSFAEHPLYGLPSFWAMLVCAIFVCCVVPIKTTVVYMLLGAATWLTATWVISGGGWGHLQDLIPFLKRGRNNGYHS
ncbi:MAG: hypothetical protein SOZ52_05840 [Pyramidobacter sp.]|nr:hypothetical protein [Pyramidobacter sp.]